MKKLEGLDHQIFDLNISFQQHQWNVMSARDINFIKNFKEELQQVTDNAHKISAKQRLCQLGMDSN